jgi:hypothetical protein
MSLGMGELPYQNEESSSTNLHEISSFFQNCKTSVKIKSLISLVSLYYLVDFNFKMHIASFFYLFCPVLQ